MTRSERVTRDSPVYKLNVLDSELSKECIDFNMMCVYIFVFILN